MLLIKILNLVGNKFYTTLETSLWSADIFSLSFEDFEGKSLLDKNPKYKTFFQKDLFRGLYIFWFF